ncbi:hypothetical protein HZH68_001536 [Vespula germanica]|uniref:Uncharacterized protein n=1 Tax=Vespula germanica TaxID=30212 RepID=A0A834NVP0_VESGE|nr:hypothetical protein HZH68_001536 [Vespula germanica]
MRVLKKGRKPARQIRYSRAEAERKILEKKVEEVEEEVEKEEEEEEEEEEVEDIEEEGGSSSSEGGVVYTEPCSPYFPDAQRVRMNRLRRTAEQMGTLSRFCGFVQTVLPPTLYIHLFPFPLYSFLNNLDTSPFLPESSL